MNAFAYMWFNIAYFYKTQGTRYVVVEYAVNILLFGMIFYCTHQLKFLLG